MLIPKNFVLVGDKWATGEEPIHDDHKQLAKKLGEVEEWKAVDSLRKIGKNAILTLRSLMD